MKTHQLFSVIFLIRKNKSSTTQGLIYARISVNGKRSEFSIKRKIDFEIWGRSRGQAKGHSIQVKRLNQYLDQMRSELFEAYDVLRKSRVLPTAEAIKSRFFDEDSSDPTLMEALEYHYKIAVTTIKIGTLKNYRTTEKYIKLFLKEKLKVGDILLKQLSYSFITKFEYFLRLHKPLDHQRKMENNTVMKHLQRFRKIISLAVQLE